MEGGDAVRKRRKTKGQLVREFYQRGRKMSPETGIEVVEGGDLVELNKPYEIVSVEDTTTEVSMYQGFRVQLLAADGDVGSLMLWKQQRVSTRSKTGAFLALLGTNTDNWLHQWVIFRAWERNNRRLELTNPPKSKVK